MASIRKRGSSYLIVVSMGYDYNGKRIKLQQKTVHPPEELTPRQVEKWLNEQAVLFERDCRHTPQPVQQLTLAKYIDLWLTDIAPGKLAKSTIRRDRQDIERILPALGHYKLTELRPEHFRNFYAELRKVIRPDTKKPLSEYTIEGVHATLCSILSDAVEGGFLSHNPAWRTYRYAGRKCEKKIADEETAQKIIAALEGESIKYETYFKLIIATGMRRGMDAAERKKLLRLLDAQNALLVESKLISFTAGFKLAWGMAKELEADGLYSFELEEEEHICHPAEQDS